MTKKNLVLGVLFILPIVVYLFFASGVNNFYRLPVLTQGVSELDSFTSTTDTLQLKGNITILGFLGEDAENKKGNIFNLNQKIYKRFYQFKDFQFVMLLPNGMEATAKSLEEELAGSTDTDTQKWHFAFGDEFALKEIFNSLQTNMALEPDLGSPYVFIIDKELQLRGREEDEDGGTLYGFDARSVAAINNKMEDDIKVVLAEYRLALKKNDNYENRRESILKKKPAQ